MELSTFHSDLTGKEIKPNAMLTKYLSLVERDNKTFFTTPGAQEATCPACGSRSRVPYASKLSMEYSSCRDCSSVFVSSRPNQESLDRFFRDSEARRYWLTELWNETQKVRHDKVLEPLKTWIETFVAETFPGTAPVRIAEFRANSWGLWETLNEGSGRLKAELVQPMFDSSLRSGGVVSVPAANATKYQAVCLVDTLGRVEDPSAALKWAADHLDKGGLCFVTTVFSTGFDVLTLGADSNALVPPDRLNLLSFEGFQSLISKSGMEIIEMSTPGVLDLQNVQAAMAQGAQVPAFVRYLVEKRAGDERFVYDFQTFLQSNGLSSLGRAVLRKGK